MGKTKKYWKGLEELENSEGFQKSVENEFHEELPTSDFLGKETLGETPTKRRDFLKFLGFSVSTATMAACETPVNKAIPYLNKPTDVTPGVANWYASTFFDGVDFCNILVKTREGRPIKIEGNNDGFTKGGTNARVNSSVLSLYDSARLKAPVANGEETSWDSADSAIKSKLESIAANGGNIRILTNSIISPSTKRALKEFKQAYPTTEVVAYDAVSSSGMLKANKAKFGTAVLPDYQFDKADVIVSVAADFLAHWPLSVRHAWEYAQGRNPKNGKMSRHFQFETNLSLTGSNADVRRAIKPSEQGAYVLALYNEIAKKAGASTYSGADVEYTDAVKKAADELWNARGKSLVVAGANDVNVQTVVNEINELLGNYGKTLNIDKQVYLRQGDDAAMEKLVADMNNGQVDALFIYGPNPVYNYHNAEKFETGLGKVGLTVSFSDREDETASLTNYILPDHHYLEAWNDANPRRGIYSLVQPTIRPLFKTRPAQESFLKWAGNDVSYHDYIKKNWEENMFPAQSKELMFESFWNSSLHDGNVELSGAKTDDGSGTLEKVVEEVKDIFDGGEEEAVVSGLSQAAVNIKKAVVDGEFELQLYMKAGTGEGNQANNPWLQELPDPISRVTWDNYVTMSPKQMNELGLNIQMGEQSPADLVELTVNGKTVKVPAVAQPGQKYGTVGLAVGYGRTKAGKTADGLGVNAFPFVTVSGGTYQYNAGASVSKAGEKYPIAATQTHHTMMGRNIVKETTLNEYKKDPKAGNPDVLLATSNHGPQPPGKVNIWDDHAIKSGHRWGLSIDLNSCIGCGACVTSCISENNVPIVGKDEVRRVREMHWLRIDRYYSSDMTTEKAEEEGLGAVEKFHAMEKASENPEVAFQPVMCQHCNHAPCETVCPVAATTHSNEGLNMMAYNRCIGTRYCANNCPYKVRRFNWFRYKDNDQFDYNMNDDLGKMVLNPDVVVRSRGVMEKCTLCVQRIQEGKLKAKKAKRKVKDGDMETACASACPTNAIVFGDLNDTEFKATELAEDPRSYTLLEEVGTQPNIFYMTKVRNKDEQEV